MNDSHAIRTATGMAPDCDPLDMTERRPSIWDHEELELDELELEEQEPAAYRVDRRFDDHELDRPADVAPAVAVALPARTAADRDHEDWFVVPDDEGNGLAWTASLQPVGRRVPWLKLGVATMLVGCIAAIAAFVLRDDRTTPRSAAAAPVAPRAAAVRVAAPAAAPPRAKNVAPTSANVAPTSANAAPASTQAVAGVPRAPAATAAPARPEPAAIAAPASEPVPEIHDAPPPRVTKAAATKSSAKRAGKRRGATSRPSAASATRVAAVPSKATGTLMISSKPPCEIVIDGVATVLMTPQRALKLKAGRHKVTLFNLAHKIDATFDVVVEPGKSTKLIRDFLTKP